MMYNGNHIPNEESNAPGFDVMGYPNISVGYSRVTGSIHLWIKDKSHFIKPIASLVFVSGYSETGISINPLFEGMDFTGSAETPLDESANLCACSNEPSVGTLLNNYHISGVYTGYTRSPANIAQFSVSTPAVAWNRTVTYKSNCEWGNGDYGDVDYGDCHLFFSNGNWYVVFRCNNYLGIRAIAKRAGQCPPADPTGTYTPQPVYAHMDRWELSDVVVS